MEGDDYAGNVWHSGTCDDRAIKLSYCRSGKAGADGRENSPGTRIPVGVEPDILDQLAVNEVFQKYFPTGTGDIFRFEETYLNTPEAILDIIKGAFENKLRYFSGYLENNDVVRVTGYLVKKSELEKLRNKKQSLNQVSIFGLGAADCQDALDRRVATHEDIKSK